MGKETSTAEAEPISTPTEPGEFDELVESVLKEPNPVNPEPTEVVEGDDPAKLKAKIEGLTKELKRVRAKSESSADVERLVGEVNALKEQVTAAKQTTPQYSLDQLESMDLEWTDLLADARAALRIAQAGNDTEGARHAADQVQKAKGQIVAVRAEKRRQESLARSAASQGTSEAAALQQEVSSLYESTVKQFPDLKDKDSELWQACNDTFSEHPRLMKTLGPLAEVVAVAMTIASNPDVVGSRDTKTRSTLLENIDQAAQRALHKGKTSAATPKGAPNFEDMPLDKFEAVLAKVKSRPR